MLVTLCEIGEAYYCLLGTIVFHVKAESKRFTDAGCRRNFKICKFHGIVLQVTYLNCTKKRSVRAARLFFLIQPIKSLICRVVVALDVVVS